MTHIVLIMMGSSDGLVNALMMTILMTRKFKPGLGLAQPCRFCFGCKTTWQTSPGQHPLEDCPVNLLGEPDGFHICSHNSSQPYRLQMLMLRAF